MGMRHFGSLSACGGGSKPSLPNPNKFRFKVKEILRQSNDWVVVTIKYLDCTNYEGTKILVYDSAHKFNKLAESGAIDPHFNETSYSPVARFEPTARGKFMAINFAKVKQPCKS